MIYKDIEKQMEKLRKKLHTEIEKSGIDTEQTLKISEELDKLIKKYYINKYNNIEENIEEENVEDDIEDNIIYREYKIAYKQIKQLAKKMGYFPTVKEWNEVAKKDIYLNNKSIEYISGLSWNKLKTKILSDLEQK